MANTSAVTEPTRAQRFEAIFRSGGLKFKNIDAFGPRVIVTCWSEDAARKIARVLTKGSFKVDGLKESTDYNEKNEGTNLNPTTHAVWRVWAHSCPGKGCIRCHA